MDVTLVREVTLDVVLVLGVMLGGRSLGRRLVNLFGVEKEFGRLDVILSRTSPVDIELPLLLTGLGIEGFGGIVIRGYIALSRKEPAAEDSPKMFEEKGGLYWLKGLTGLVGLANRVEV